MSPLLSVQLMDMGFTREHCLDALLNTANLEQATDYILTHPPPAANDAPGLSMDMNLSEEDQMMRAIAMSLGENVLVSTEEVGGGGDCVVGSGSLTYPNTGLLTNYLLRLSQ